MTVRAVIAVLLTVALVAAAVELSTWVLVRAVSTVVPAAAVSEVEAEVPNASEIDAPAPASVPALTR
jgi:hypothetical protein